MSESMTDQYKPAFGFLSSLGHVGADLADFVRTYGVEVAALQLEVDGAVLKKALKAMVPLAELGRVLVEVSLRRGSQSLPMTSLQRGNFVVLLENIRAQVGTTELARRLGVTRQALYHVASKNGPATVSTLVLSIAGLLGYSTVLEFLDKLTGGVPDCSHIKRTKRKYNVQA